MKILAIDTSCRHAGVAVTEDRGQKAADRYGVLGARVVGAFDGAVEGASGGASGAGGWRHSERLLPIIAEVLAGTGLALADLGAVAYTCGPGSFTGLRIGAATALGLARGAGLRAVGVPTLDALAYTGIVLHGFPQVAALLDARRGQVYAALYERGDVENPLRRVTDYLAAPEAEILAAAGDAVVLRDAVDPAAVGLLAAQLVHRTRETADAPTLLYVRAPEAVRTKERRESEQSSRAAPTPC